MADTYTRFYDTILVQPLKSITGTRKIHKVLAQKNIIHCRHVSCFCSKPLIFQCFSPVAYSFDGIS